MSKGGIETGQDKSVSNEDRQVLNAKMELLQAKDGSGQSLYEHLSHILKDILNNSINEAEDCLEKLSHNLKMNTKRLEPWPSVTEPLCSNITQEWTMLKTVGGETTVPNPTLDEEKELKEGRRLSILPDLMKQSYMFEMAGCGVPSTHYSRIALCMRELVLLYNLKFIRFWGKVLGTMADYFVIEAELVDNADAISAQVDSPDDNKNESRQSEAGSQDWTDELPVTYKPPTVIPAQPSGVGVNSKVYFVSNQLGKSWELLPDVTPDQIVKARQIRIIFTGDLNHTLATFPPFPGTEKHYLRAQIARISAGTIISPIGYYKFEEDGEEEEESLDSRETCVVDEDFEGVSTRDLCDSSLQYWVHHHNTILPQGRTQWYNPADNLNKENEDEEEEEEQRNEPDELEQEIPEPLLMPIADDSDVGQSPSWVTRMTSHYVSDHSMVSVMSTRWPGAAAVATDRGKFFENIYIGLGQKCLGEEFNPQLPTEPLTEFPTGPEVIETEDPTPEEEAVLRAAMKDDDDLDIGEEGEEEDGDNENEEEEIEFDD